MAATQGNGNGSYLSGKPPTGYFNVTQRLFRGYGPLALLVAFVVCVAVFVPSKVPKSTASAVNANQSLSNSNAGQPNGVSGSTGSNAATNTNAGATNGGATASHSGSVVSSGSQGSAGKNGSTVTSAGKVEKCDGQQWQVPGDPYSPPCVTFSGGNGGVTSKGVTSNSIVVSVRLTSDESFGQTLAILAGAQLRDTNADNVRTLNALAQYFNTHFQFYGRKIVLKYFNGQGSLANELQGYGQAQAEDDAITAAKQIKSFADLTAESEPYATALEQQGVLGFGDPYMPGYWHQDHAPYDWSIFTDGTDLATDVANYADQRLCPAGSPAVFAGGNLKNAGRKFAGIAPENELYQTSATTFKNIMTAHGCDVSNFAYTLDLGTESQQASNLVAQLKAGGYTTILCGCDPIFPVYLTGQMAQQNYFPEFVEIGAALIDQDYVGQLYNQEEYEHAFGISPNEPSVPYYDTIGYAAYKTVEPNSEPAFFVDQIYLQMDMFAIGLQMAGPDLTPNNFEKGMFSFPQRLGPAGLWGWSPTQYTIPNDFREVCWSPSTVSAFNGKQGAYITPLGTARWTQDTIPKGKPDCPIPAS